MDGLNTEFEWWCGHNGHPIWSKRSFKKAVKELEVRTNSLASSREYSPTSLSPASEMKILRATRGGVWSI